MNTKKHQLKSKLAWSVFLKSIKLKLNFWLVGWGLPHLLSRKNPVETLPTGFYIQWRMCTSHTSCAKVAILLLQDLSTLCVADMYGIYFHLSIQCLQYNKFMTSWTCLIRSNDGRSTSQKSQTALNIFVHDVINLLLYIYIIYYINI